MSWDCWSSSRSFRRPTQSFDTLWRWVPGIRSINRGRRCLGRLEQRPLYRSPFRFSVTIGPASESCYVKSEGVTFFSKITAELRRQRITVLMRVRNEDPDIGAHLVNDSYAVDLAFDDRS